MGKGQKKKNSNKQTSDGSAPPPVVGMSVQIVSKKTKVPEPAKSESAIEKPRNSKAKSNVDVVTKPITGSSVMEPHASKKTQRPKSNNTVTTAVKSTSSEQLHNDCTSPNRQSEDLQDSAISNFPELPKYVDSNAIASGNNATQNDAWFAGVGGKTLQAQQSENSETAYENWDDPNSENVNFKLNQSTASYTGSVDFNAAEKACYKNEEVKKEPNASNFSSSYSNNSPWNRSQQIRDTKIYDNVKEVGNENSRAQDGGSRSDNWRTAGQSGKSHNVNWDSYRSDNESDRKQPYRGGQKLDSFMRNSNRNGELTSEDKEFNNFWKSLRAPGEKKYVRVKEIEGDLFEMSADYALAHCVAEDMNMGSGIAVQFSQKFKRRDELYQQNQKQGGLAVLSVEGGRFIYYLVTKRESNGKPTLHTMWSSLLKLQKHVEEHKVNKLAIPRIGCGLDRLEWSDIKAMLEYVFKNTEVEICVCNFQQPEDSSAAPVNKSKKCSVVNATYPLVQIESGTIVIYFGSEDGFVTKEIESLDTKFHISSDYRNARRCTGEIIPAYKANNNYMLCGFIIRKSKGDVFDFGNFQKCVTALNKLNRKSDHQYQFVGIEAFLDDDDLIMSKIVNILKYSMHNVAVYVCWSGSMLKFMPQERKNDYY